MASNGWAGAESNKWRKRLASTLPATCYRCSTRGRIHTVTARDPWDVDHIVSQKDGGKHEASNLAVSCRRGNRAHGAEISRALTAQRRAHASRNRNEPNW
ncbi:HNH endonuclease [Clavibacter michiganensis subsp. michiganensis]|uniref:HNH endonuclease n=1 Tax=Clavibacter michiganensis TaxID=28447 RepID=UPI0013031FDE|nr:HNH endonuclease [Clavibacter michiganensis subsp. michiganensis]